MHSFLRQATASQVRSIGPFVDDTDFKTAKTSLTIANTDINLIINGAVAVAKNSGGGTSRVNGVYSLTFDATDTATVGEMFVSVKVASALPVFATFVVLEEAVYDALFAASAPGYGTAQTGDTYALANGAAGFVAIAGYIDTEVAAIKTQTDKLTFTVANQVDCNVLDWKSATAPAMTGDAYARLGAPAGASVSADVAALKTDLDAGVTIAAASRPGIRKNTALSNFTFLMRDSTNHQPATGKTVSLTRKIDNGSFSAAANSVAEVASGVYTVDLAAGDLNGDIITLRATATGCDDYLERIRTTP